MSRRRGRGRGRGRNSSDGDSGSDSDRDDTITSTSANLAGSSGGYNLRNSRGDLPGSALGADTGSDDGNNNRPDSNSTRGKGRAKVIKKKCALLPTQVSRDLDGFEIKDARLKELGLSSSFKLVTLPTVAVNSETERVLSDRKIVQAHVKTRLQQSIARFQAATTSPDMITSGNPADITLRTTINEWTKLADSTTVSKWFWEDFAGKVPLEVCRHAMDAVQVVPADESLLCKALPFEALEVMYTAAWKGLANDRPGFLDEFGGKDDFLTAAVSNTSIGKSNVLTRVQERVNEDIIAGKYKYISKTFDGKDLVVDVPLAPFRRENQGHPYYKSIDTTPYGDFKSPEEVAKLFDENRAADGMPQESPPQLIKFRGQEMSQLRVPKEGDPGSSPDNPIHLFFASNEPKYRADVPKDVHQRRLDGVLRTQVQLHPALQRTHLSDTYMRRGLVAGTGSLHLELIAPSLPNATFSTVARDERLNPRNAAIVNDMPPVNVEDLLLPKPGQEEVAPPVAAATAVPGNAAATDPVADSIEVPKIPDSAETYKAEELFDPLVKGDIYVSTGKKGLAGHQLGQIATCTCSQLATTAVLDPSCELCYATRDHPMQHHVQVAMHSTGRLELARDELEKEQPDLLDDDINSALDNVIRVTKAQPRAVDELLALLKEENYVKRTLDSNGNLQEEGVTAVKDLFKDGPIETVCGYCIVRMLASSHRAFTTKDGFKESLVNKWRLSLVRSKYFEAVGGRPDRSRKQKSLARGEEAASDDDQEAFLEALASDESAKEVDSERFDQDDYESDDLDEDYHHDANAPSDADGAAGAKGATGARFGSVATNMWEKECGLPLSEYRACLPCGWDTCKNHAHEIRGPATVEGGVESVGPLEGVAYNLHPEHVSWFTALIPGRVRIKYSEGHCSFCISGRNYPIFCIQAGCHRIFSALQAIKPDGEMVSRCNEHLQRFDWRETTSGPYNVSADLDEIAEWTAGHTTTPDFRMTMLDKILRLAGRDYTTDAPKVHGVSLLLRLLAKRLQERFLSDANAIAEADVARHEALRALCGILLRRREGLMNAAAVNRELTTADEEDEIEDDRESADEQRMESDLDLLHELSQSDWGSRLAAAPPVAQGPVEAPGAPPTQPAAGIPPSAAPALSGPSSSPASKPSKGTKRDNEPSSPGGYGPRTSQRQSKRANPHGTESDPFYLPSDGSSENDMQLGSDTAIFGDVAGGSAEHDGVNEQGTSAAPLAPSTATTSAVEQVHNGMLRKLVDELGFEEDAAEVALRATHDNYENAVARLVEGGTTSTD